MVGVDDEDVAIPADTEMHIVYKAFYNTVVGLSWGKFRAEVAVGRLDDAGNGMYSAEYCFAIVYYSNNSDCPHDSDQPFVMSGDLYKSDLRRETERLIAYREQLNL